MIRYTAGAGSVAVGLVPFDAGREGWRMGAGPGSLFDESLRLELERRGLDVRVDPVRPGTDWGTELRTTVDLHRRAAEHVQSAVSVGSSPVVVSGDCSMTVGVIAGTEEEDLETAGVRRLAADATAEELDSAVAAWAAVAADHARAARDVRGPGRPRGLTAPYKGAGLPRSVDAGSRR